LALPLQATAKVLSKFVRKDLEHEAERDLDASWFERHGLGKIGPQILSGQ
jgi:hypothetical protein